MRACFLASLSLLCAAAVGTARALPPEGAPPAQESLSENAFISLTGLVRSCANALASVPSTGGELADTALSTALARCTDVTGRVIEATYGRTIIVQPRQKRELLAQTDDVGEELERIIALLNERRDRALSQGEPEPAARPHALLTQATLLENQVRLFLAALNAQETWSMRARVAGGAARTADKETHPLMGLGVAAEIDLGNQFELGLDLQLRTPLHEESGMVALPPHQVDVVDVAEAWLAFKRYAQVQFKLGLFPDTHGYLLPATWPFVSMQGTIHFIQGAAWDWDVLVRHDMFGAFSPTQASPRPQRLERTLVQTELVRTAHLADRPDADGRNVVAQGRAVMRLHWYTDQENQLASQSLGRRRYLDAVPAAQDTRYRITEMLLQASVDFYGRVGIEAGWESWHNFLLDAQNKAWLAHVGMTFGNLAPAAARLTMAANRAVIPCAAMPPLQIASHTLPGTASTFFDVTTAYPFSSGFAAEAWARKHHVRVLAGQSPCRPENPTRFKPELLDTEFGVGLTYTFPPA